MGPYQSGDDPRATLPENPFNDIRPVVALSRPGAPSWVLLTFAVVLGIILFGVLEVRRRNVAAPAVHPHTADRVAMPSPPPPLLVPSPPQVPVAIRAVAPAPLVQSVRSIKYATSVSEQQVAVAPQPLPPSQLIGAPVSRRGSSEPALILDTSVPRIGAVTPQSGGELGLATAPSPAGIAITGSRARAGTMPNQSMTVPQGTLVPAVLETALDSTRRGLARAIVSSDVRGFDGSQILIPRGSRLIGEYFSEAQPGQRRALVNWFRLLRPDGITIAVGSPSADPVGRGGIEARVNSHFFERFAGAILQSALDIGINFATRRAGNDAVILLPGSVQNSTSQAIQSQQVTPTLSVRQGTSISIFVARDLDFTGVERSR